MCRTGSHISVLTYAPMSSFSPFPGPHLFRRISRASRIFRSYISVRLCFPCVVAITEAFEGSNSWAQFWWCWLMPEWLQFPILITLPCSFYRRSHALEVCLNMGTGSCTLLFTFVGPALSCLHHIQYFKVWGQMRWWWSVVTPAFFQFRECRVYKHIFSLLLFFLFFLPNIFFTTARKSSIFPRSESFEWGFCWHIFYFSKGDS